MPKRKVRRANSWIVISPKTGKRIAGPYRTEKEALKDWPKGQIEKVKMRIYYDEDEERGEVKGDF